MEFDVEEAINVLRAGVSLVPPALIAVILLGGPTAVWLLYIFVVQPVRNRRIRALAGSAMWVCPRCRSVNELTNSHCYRCDAVPTEEELEVIDAHPAGPSRLVPVGPGLDFGVGGDPMAWHRSILPDAPPDVSPDAPWADNEEPVEAEEIADPMTVPDIAAMTEVIEAPRRRRSASSPQPVAAGRRRRSTARSRRTTTAGPARDPDDPPAA